MGLTSEIQADIAAAFDTDLADAVQEFTGKRVIVGQLDPVTDTQTSTTIEYSGRGVFSDYDTKEVDGLNILRTDTKLIALQNEVTEIPAIGDKISGLFDVINVGKDPADCTYQIQLRKV